MVQMRAVIAVAGSLSKKSANTMLSLFVCMSAHPVQIVAAHHANFSLANAMMAGFAAVPVQIPVDQKAMNAALRQSAVHPQTAAYAAQARPAKAASVLPAAQIPAYQKAMNAAPRQSAELPRIAGHVAQAKHARAASVLPAAQIPAYQKVMNAALKRFVVSLKTAAHAAQARYAVLESALPDVQIPAFH